MIQNENYPICEMCGCAIPSDADYCPSCGEDVLFAAPHFKEPVRELTEVERIIFDLPPIHQPIIAGWDDYSIYEPIIDDGSTSDSNRWIGINRGSTVGNTTWTKQINYQYQ